MRRLLTLTLVSGAALTTACAEAEDDLSDAEKQELRSGFFPDGGLGEDPSLPGNGDLTIYFAGDANIPGCDIWDFQSNGVSNAQSPNHDLIFTVEGDDIRDPNGDLLCRREGNELFERMRDPNEQVVFSVMGPFIFDGDLQLNGTFLQNLIELKSKLLYTFNGKDVYEGLVLGGEMLVSANVNIRWSSRMRKFAIASLIAGECGGPGIPPHPEDDH
jgi:hypothetical protein